MHWLKDPVLRHRQTFERDTKLSDKEKTYLRGIHKRNNDYAKNPSPIDVQYLEEAYRKLILDDCTHLILTYIIVSYI